jgi:hypothetical protein
VADDAKIILGRDEWAKEGEELDLNGLEGGQNEE